MSQELAISVLHINIYIFFSANDVRTKEKAGQRHYKATKSVSHKERAEISKLPTVNIILIILTQKN